MLSIYERPVEGENAFHHLQFLFTALNRLTYWPSLAYTEHRSAWVCLVSYTRGLANTSNNFQIKCCRHRLCIATGERFDTPNVINYQLLTPPTSYRRYDSPPASCKPALPLGLARPPSKRPDLANGPRRRAAGGRICKD